MMTTIDKFFRFFSKTIDRQPMVSPQVSKIAVICASGLIGAYIGYKVETYFRLKTSIKIAENIIDNSMGPASDGLPTEELEYPVIEQEANPGFAGLGLGADIDNTRMTTRSVRRVKHGRKTHYVAKVVSAAKLKFGTPVRSDANILVVRRFLVAMTKAHGLRETHARQVVSIAVEMVFVYDRTELSLAELRPYLQVRGSGYWHWVLSHVGMAKPYRDVRDLFAET